MSITQPESERDREAVKVLCESARDAAMASIKLYLIASELVDLIDNPPGPGTDPTLPGDVDGVIHYVNIDQTGSDPRVYRVEIYLDRDHG